MIWFLRWGGVIKTLCILVNDRASERAKSGGDS
jgi:hypothetical protein